ncbi:MAG TPA: polysaccharide pyruvyl transferase family protein [Candidatus Hydrogenedentes bacterium]|nr:polysaccharide pyruvyl transferase family protein [Candidatus Hydrogenedentota bacterium]HPJ98864.1 polysaccharide pyruvyl transferase family protein [Candidatus Hydrogenedentota bacterium]
MGAALDTANLGVSALSLATLLGVLARVPSARVTVLDYGRGFRAAAITSEGEEYPFFRYGSANSRRLYRRESIYNLALSSYLGGLGHPLLRLWGESHAVLDVTGGDSFTDLYGNRFFKSITLRKRILLREKASLVLLPQTYGPFASPRNRRIAQDIIRRSAMAWARDERSFEVLRDLLGDAFDPVRHRSGVDVAFVLPSVAPAEDALGDAADWLADRSTPLAGLNVSGLLMNQPDAAARQYGFKADYSRAAISLLRRLLRESDARILLIPHVVTPPGHYESDIEACNRVAAAVPEEAGGRVAVLPALRDPREVKWVISQLDLFCGTRMHSTIAALSTGVPAAAIAYSPKTLGVFETCAQGAHVADPRHCDTDEVVERLWRSWSARDDARTSLQAALPGVLRRAEEQMDVIVRDTLAGPASAAEGGAPP